jgi:hypothetical protein
MASHRKSSFRRAILAGLGAATLFGPAAFSGCAVNFAPPSQVETLRVFSVSVDKPYIAPIAATDCAADPAKCTVSFDMEVYDGYGVATQGSERPINILWIGGCFDPEGDQYSLCLVPLLGLYQQAAPALDDAIKNHLPPKFPKGLPVGLGKKFSMIVPDIVSQRPKPQYGPHYGVAYVFFLACAGTFGLLDKDPSAAGDFPIGCFDSQTGERLGAESFVPGYTQVYSFEDGRVNQNPPVNDVIFDEKILPEDDSAAPTVGTCDVPEQDRNLPPSCSRQDPYTQCEAHTVDVDVPPDVAEDDPEATDQNGKQLKESVWVDYFSSAGNFEEDIKLVRAPDSSQLNKREVKWIAPPVSGDVTMWVVVRDSRGGSTTLTRTVRVGN